MNYISVQNIDSLSHWVKQALKIKKKPLKNKKLGKNKTLGVLFFNPSKNAFKYKKAALTRMNVMVMNLLMKVGR
jgi:N-succinyl-L-ornithine transcarbamylase